MAKRLAEQRIKDLIQNLEFEPLKISVEKQKPERSEPTGDALLNIAWKSGAEKFIAEILGQATPKQIETKILRLEKFTNPVNGGRAARKRFYPLVVAPFLSEKTLNRLAEAEISGIDLSGNGVIVIPDRLFVYRTGEKNKFLSSVPIKNVFRGTSSLVSRVFFSKPEYENVGQILNEVTARGGKITFPTVSKVLKTLEEELLVSKTETVRLLDAKKLLDLLIKNYRRPQIRRTLSVKCADLSPALEKMSKNAKKQNTPFAWDYPARYTVMPSDSSAMKIYTESIDDLLKEVDFAETSRFPDIILLETDEPTVYFDRRKEKDSYFLSPLETYLQLVSQGKREQEAAILMTDKLLNFKY
jgi:hypothetical protein